MADGIIKATVEPRVGETIEHEDDGPRVGTWYYLKVKDHDGKVWDELVCCTHIGTNFAEVKNVGRSSWRIHFDEFWDECRKVEDPEAVIAERIAWYRTDIARLMGEVRLLTARLGVTQHALPAPAETSALALRGGDEPVNEYKAALAKAEKTDLPKLFEQIKSRNESLARWMSASLLPLEAEAEAMKGVMGSIKRRIFSVELYAGLTEDVVEVRGGEPAPTDEKIHLMQRRCYMDEECLARYEVGGMEFRDIARFDDWLARPENMNRILPFPRTIVAFQVRRNRKEPGEVPLHELIRIAFEGDTNKLTFLYIRNGERLYRLSTSIEFGEHLFPDVDAQVLASGKVYAKIFGRSVDRLATEGEYLEAVAKHREQKRKYDEAPASEKWRYAPSLDPTRDYVAYTPDTVYYDDISTFIADEMARHNRLVLVLQGILDRSPIMQPHPPWQLWTHEGFTSGLQLVYDDSRALTVGEKPDFEAYRARLNASLKVGSVTVGQGLAWEYHEGVKEIERRKNSRTYNQDMLRYLPDPYRYRPYGNPGPGTLARVARIAPRARTCTYEWERKRMTRDRWGEHDPMVRCTFTTPIGNVLNVDAYKPGDFRMFFDDPRTRAEYLAWAPLLLIAEEYHAGLRKVGPKDGK